MVLSVKLKLLAQLSEEKILIYIAIISNNILI